MIDPRINLLNREDNQQPKGNKIFKISKFIVYLFVILVLAFVVFSYQVLFTNNSVSDIFSGKISIFSQLKTLAGDNDRLLGESEDRINFLLLGMGGAGHEGPYLTDTIILASIKPSTRKVSMVSVPRDLLVEIPGYGWWKINNANAFGEQKNDNNGAELAMEVVQNTLNQPIHYFIRIDFAGFEQAIDDMGGIKVFVDKAFTDYQYPTNDYKYQVVSYEEGWQTMDGDTALKFSRSRHGNNGEGSDFARSKRQQKVIEAVKKRILSYNFFLSPRKINNIMKNLSEHLRTNMEPWELIKLAKLAEKIDTQNIITRVLDDSPGGYLYANKVNSAYVLQPKGDDFSQIQYMVKSIFKAPETLSEKVVLTAEIRNGTSIPGLASRNATELKLAGYKVNTVGNAPTQDYQTTKIYKLSSEELKDQIEFLETKYKLKVETKEVPDWIKHIVAPDLDFFVILGQDTPNANP